MMPTPISRISASPLDCYHAAGLGQLQRTFGEAEREAAIKGDHDQRVTRFDSLLELAAALQGACHHTGDHEEAHLNKRKCRAPEARRPRQ
jgi:hypothetical protein